MLRSVGIYIVQFIEIHPRLNHFLEPASSRAFFSKTDISSAAKSVLAISYIKIETMRTVLLQLGLIHLQLQPGPVDHLVNEHGTQEDLAKGARKGLISRHLST